MKDGGSVLQSPSLARFSRAERDPRTVIRDFSQECQGLTCPEYAPRIASSFCKVDTAGQIERQFVDAFQQSHLKSRATYFMIGITLLYATLGTLYAVLTPPWQVPDEPAHFNYVKYIATEGRLPELRQGDYPHDYLEELKRRRFPLDMPIDGIRYEFHQPPLYYLLLAPIYRLAGVYPSLPMLLTLRLCTLLLGVASLWVGYRVVGAIYPDRPLLAVGTAGFAATLPMHLAMTAAVNNDVLAELLLGLVTLSLVTKGGMRWSMKRTMLLGALLGLCLLTKLQAYVGFGIALFALRYDAWRLRHNSGAYPWRLVFTRALILGGVALALASPWLLRNARVYGLDDLWAQGRHAEVVAGQLTTADYVTQVGLPTFLRRLVVTTFQSFWGQFGWMGVVLHPRFYLGALALCGIAGLGLVHYAASWLRQGHRLPLETRRGLGLLAVWALLTTAGFVWYNLWYVQHQGRYLFPAIVPWGLFFALGMYQVLAPAMRITVLTLLVVLAGLLLSGLFTGDIKSFTLLLLALLALGLGIGHRLEERWPGTAMLLFFVCMGSIALTCLLGYIIPGLS